METTGTIEEKKQESVQSEPKKAMVSPGQLRIIKRNGSVVDFDGIRLIVFLKSLPQWRRVGVPSRLIRRSHSLYHD